ncbi:MAG: PAS domain S-box protein [bacterium LCO1.1]|uniref:PAS domain S-box protein n=1 Tax=Candidatus Weimeria bifida TaxID=2599074 RepID=A0A6N7J0M9_9FIRM|nr:PAS domain S-box protein [Candidatus Weimeria bifida]
MDGEFHFNKQEKKYLSAFPGMLVIFQVLDGMDRVILASDNMLDSMNLTYDELATYFINGFKPLIRYTPLKGETQYFAGKSVTQKRKRAVLRYVTYADVTNIYNKLHKLEEDSSGQDFVYKQILDAIPTGIFWKDIDRKFLGANKAFLDAYGFSSEDAIIGKTDEDMGWHPEPEHFKKVEEEVLSEKKTKTARTKNLIQGRERDIVALKSPLYDKDGNVSGIVGSFIDVTEVEDED